MFDEGDWSDFLSRELGGSVRVRFGRARHRVLDARGGALGTDGRRVYDVRLSAFFGEAPPDVRDAVVRWLRVGRRARKSAALLDAWIEEAVEALPPAEPRRAPVRLRGAVHDLDALRTELLEAGAHLPRLERPPTVTWGRRTKIRARRTLQLGCFVAADRLVRVHPVLDQEWVPAWFVRYVLFHELLHAALPTERSRSGRVRHHGPVFKSWERRYPDYARAVLWLERNLSGLLRVRPPRARVAPPPPRPETGRPVQGELFPLA